jgi:hypothetical protein
MIWSVFCEEDDEDALIEDLKTEGGLTETWLTGLWTHSSGK